eukprot:scaffold180528_cov53-Attheya_sp.AAC.3
MASPPDDFVRDTFAIPENAYNTPSEDKDGGQTLCSPPETDFNIRLVTPSHDLTKKTIQSSSRFLDEQYYDGEPHRSNSDCVQVTKHPPPPPLIVLTTEQKKRIEENKRRALELREKRKRSIDQEQKTRMEQNKKRALELRKAAEARKRPNTIESPSEACNSKTSGSNASNSQSCLPVSVSKSSSSGGPTRVGTTSLMDCSNCGGSKVERNSLCIIWKHRGELVIKRGKAGSSRRSNQHHWSCCDRLEKQPCQIGMHSQQNQSSKKPPELYCDCYSKAHLRRMRKDGSNCGRYYFECPVEGSMKCKYFKWADSAFNLPKFCPKPSPDGIKEWEYISPDPFNERLEDILNGSHGGPTVMRKRLIASLLIQEMCAIAAKGSGWLELHVQTKDLVEKVRETWKSHTVDKHLLPMTKEHIFKRFGVSSQGPTPTVQECQVAFREILTNNRVIQSTIGSEGLIEMPLIPDELNLSGLERYFSL